MILVRECACCSEKGNLTIILIVVSGNAGSRTDPMDSCRRSVDIEIGSQRLMLASSRDDNDEGALEFYFSVFLLKIITNIST